MDTINDSLEDTLCDFLTNDSYLYDYFISFYPEKLLVNQFEVNRTEGKYRVNGVWLSKLWPFLANVPKAVSSEPSYDILSARQSLIYSIDKECISFGT